MRLASTTHALMGHGFGQGEIDKIEAALPSAFDIRFVFNQWTLGEEFCTGVLGIPAEKLNDPGVQPAEITSASSQS